MGFSILDTTQQDILPDNGPAKYTPPTGFGENYQAGVGVAFDTMLSVSKRINFYAPIRDRNKQLDAYVREGLLSETEVHENTRPDILRTVDYASLAHAARRKGLDIETDEEIADRVRDDVKHRLSYAEDIFRRSTIMGKAGRVFGTLNVVALDPAELPGYFVGVGIGAKGASLLSKLRKAAVYGGGVAATTAAAEEPFVYQWNRELGIDYSVKDSLTHIMLAAGIGTAIPATAISAPHVARKLRHLIDKRAIRRIAEKDPAVAEAVRITERVAEEGLEGVKRSTPNEVTIAGRKIKLGESAELPGTEHTEAGALEFWSGVEGEVTRINDTKPKIQPTRQADPVEVKLEGPEQRAEMDTVYDSARKVLSELPEGDVNITKVVDDLTTETETLNKVVACISGAIV